MREVRIQGLHRIEVRNRKGERSEAVVEIRYRRIKVLAPVAEQKLYPALELTVIHATELTEPKDRERIEWKLITDLTVRSREDAIEKAPLVRLALEDRDLSQDTEIGLQGGGGQT
jgi:hypothetical protein